MSLFVSPPPPSSSSPTPPFDPACALIQPLLSVYVDAETTPAEAEQVAAHLAAGCARCANELAFLQLSQAMIARSTVRVAVPAGLSERIARATYARPTLADQVRALLRPAPVRVAAGSFVVAASLAVILMTRGGGNDATIAPVVASRGRAAGPVAAAPPRRPRLPNANTIIAKNSAAGARPKSAPLRENARIQPRPNVVLPRVEDNIRSVTQNPAPVARRDRDEQVRPAAPLVPDGSARVVAAAAPPSLVRPRVTAPPISVPAPRIIVHVPSRESIPVPSAPPVVIPAAPPSSAPSTRVAVATPANPGNGASVMMTASVASGALKEEGGRLRIVQQRDRGAASLPTVEAEPVERVRNAETRFASAYQELGQGQGGSGLLVGSR